MFLKSYEVKEVYFVTRTQYLYNMYMLKSTEVPSLV